MCGGPDRLPPRLLQDPSTRASLVDQTTVQALTRVVNGHPEASKQFSTAKDLLTAIATMEGGPKCIQDAGASELFTPIPGKKRGASFRGPTTRSFKVLVLGKAGTGKTCLITRASRGVFTSNVQSTLGVSLIYFYADNGGGGGGGGKEEEKKKEFFFYVLVGWGGVYGWWGCEMSNL